MTVHVSQKFKNALVKHVFYVTVCTVGSPVIWVVGDFLIFANVFFSFWCLLVAASGRRQLDEDC